MFINISPKRKRKKPEQFDFRTCSELTRKLIFNEIGRIVEVRNNN
jgi:hypothetical protein